MEKYPELTKDQLKRLRDELVRLRLAKNRSEAMKITSNWKRCKEQAINLLHTFDGVTTIEDIAELYIVDDPIDLKPIDKQIEVDQTELLDDESKRRSRGKGKKPEKVMYPIRLEVDQLTKLKELGGNVSAHIRCAIDAYLSSI